MRTIGIRATPSNVVFAIYETDDKSIVNVEKIKIPAAMNVPEALKYVRNNLLDILREYDVKKAGIRITEPVAQNLSIERIQLEGVIQEAFASSNLESYYIGAIGTIAARLLIPKEDFKKYTKGPLTFDIENWKSLSEHEREAVLCAVGA